MIYDKSIHIFLRLFKIGYRIQPGCKLEPVYPTNHGYISNLAGKKYNLPVTLTGKKIEANMRQNGLWGTIPTILVLNLMMTKSLLNQRRTNISFICILCAQMFMFFIS